MAGEAALRLRRDLQWASRRKLYSLRLLSLYATPLQRWVQQQIHNKSIQPPLARQHLCHLLRLIRLMRINPSLQQVQPLLHSQEPARVPPIHPPHVSSRQPLINSMVP